MNYRPRRKYPLDVHYSPITPPQRGQMSIIPLTTLGNRANFVDFTCFRSATLSITEQTEGKSINKRSPGQSVVDSRKSANFGRANIYRERRANSLGSG